MNGMGLRDVAQIVGALSDTRENTSSADGIADAAFASVLKKSAGAPRWRETDGAADVSAHTGRFSLAGASRADGALGTPEGSAAADKLAEYLSMPLSRQMFYMVLASLGISPEEYEAMPPAEQAKVAEKVAQRLKENAEAQVKAAQVAVARDKEGLTAGL